jgi:alkylation response protein AidB-like acyl-CoA dehydrogenase
MVRGAITYPLAGLAAAITATAATVPLGPQPPFVITAVWISAAAVAGWLVLLLADRITIRTTNGDRS